MDRAFIENNHIIERYLTGKLPYKGAQDLERYCREHPEILDELKFGDSLSAGMRLMEASGRPPGWQEPKIPWWKRWEFTAALGGACVILLVVLAVLGSKYSDRKHDIAKLQQKLVDGPLEAPGAIQTTRITPDRTGPGGSAVLNLSRGKPPALADVRVDVSFSTYRSFRVTLDNKGGVRVGSIHNLLRDSNGELRLSVNTSALGVGDYQAAIEGVPLSGQPVGVAWMKVRVAE